MSYPSYYKGNYPKAKYPNRKDARRVKSLEKIGRFERRCKCPYCINSKRLKIKIENLKMKESKRELND